MTPFRELIDKIFNWSGGAYVGLSTLVINGMAVAEYASGTPMVVSFPDGRSHIFIVHAAPQWFVGLAGVYMAILGLFWLGRPINTYVNAKAAEKGTPPTSPAPEPIPGGEKVPDPAAPKPGG